MTRRLTSSTFIIALTAGIPNILAALPTDGTPRIALTLLDMAPAANTCIGIDETGRVIAIVTTDDGQITQIGLATLDTVANLIFGQAELIMNGDGLLLQMAKVGGALMNGDQVLMLDPRIVALAIHKIGLGARLAGVVAAIEGEGADATLTFGSVHDIGTGAAIVATKVIVADAAFIVATVGDITLATAVKKSGQTLVATGNIGHVDSNLPGTITDVTASGLAEAGFGIAEPAFASQRQQLPLLDAAA